MSTRTRGVFVAVVLGAFAGLIAPASAHATLESTDPPTGSVIATTPHDVVVRFDEQVSISPSAVEVYDSQAKRVDSGGAKHVPGDSHAVEVAVGSLRPGGYVVTWRVISADSHPVHGAFTFFVGTSRGADVQQEAAQLLSHTGGSRTVGVVYGVVRWLAFLALACVVGAVLCALALWPAAHATRRLRALAWSSLLVLIGATLAAYALQGVYGGGLPLTRALDHSVLATTWHSRFGEVYALRLLVLAVSVPLLAQILQGVRTRIAAGAAAVVGLALVSTWGLADHASTGKLVWISMPFDAVHLGAVAVWVGGLVAVLAVILPSAGDERDPAVHRFSAIALSCAIAVGATGLFAAWRQVGLSRGALTSTPYGKLVIAMTVGYLLLLGFASMSRTAVHGDLALTPGRPKQPAMSRGPGAMAASAAHKLRGAVAAELAIALTVFAVGAMLVEAQPADQVYGAPYAAEVKAGPDLLDVVVEPTRVGPLVIHMYVLNADGTPADVPEVDATLSDTKAGISGLTVPLHQAGPNHFLTNGFAIPIAGTWKLFALVRTDAIDEYDAEPITVHIH